jgi:hypothetical protein
MIRGQNSGGTREQHNHRSIGDVLAGRAPVNEARAGRIDGPHSGGQRLHQGNGKSPRAQCLPGKLSRIERFGAAGLSDGFRCRRGDHTHMRLRARECNFESQHCAENRLIREERRQRFGGRKTLNQAHRHA